NYENIFVTVSSTLNQFPLQWHVEAGLVAQFVELPDLIAQMEPPEEW
ncbi:3882_t:CDS:1, partial [Acaulospora colombiana]